MPTYRTGNMWDVFEGIDYFVITTNAVIKNNGAVVMGAGIAKQVRDNWPGVDVQLGKAISRMGGGAYGYIQGSKLGIFQVKYHYKDQASLRLIEHSAEMLAKHARAYPHHDYALNFPGIGNGKLNRADVEPLLSILPKNVQVWTFQ